MPNFCRSSSMQHINHSVAAAAFLQDVWLDWLRHLQEHNAAQQRAFTHRTKLWQKKRFKIFNCNLNVTKHTNSHIVVTNKDTGSKNKRKWSQFVSKRSFMCRKRASSWMIKIFCPLLAAPNNCVKKRRDSGFLQIFAQNPPHHWRLRDTHLPPSLDCFT